MSLNGKYFFTDWNFPVHFTWNEGTLVPYWRYFVANFEVLCCWLGSTLFLTCEYFVTDWEVVWNWLRSTVCCHWHRSCTSHLTYRYFDSDCEVLCCRLRTIGSTLLQTWRYFVADLRVLCCCWLEVLCLTCEYFVANLEVLCLTWSIVSLTDGADETQGQSDKTDEWDPEWHQGRSRLHPCIVQYITEALPASLYDIVICRCAKFGLIWGFSQGTLP